MSKRLALLSAYDKSEVVEFATSLCALGFDILASGGTAKVLTAAGVSVISVEEFTGQKPVLEHRVVTLHPKLHGGLLATHQMVGEMKELGWRRIEVVYVNLYPLEEAIQMAQSGLERGWPGVSVLGDVIDKMDIGGPAMLRAAAKGLRYVIHDRSQIPKLLRHLEVFGDTEGHNDLAYRIELMFEVVRRTRAYDAVMEDFLTPLVHAKAFG